MRLDLRIVGEGTDVFPGLRPIRFEAGRTRISLAPAADVAGLTPGSYELLVLTLGEGAAPLALRMMFLWLGGGERGFDLVETAPGRWTGRAVAARAVGAFSLEVEAEAAGRLAVTSVEISAREPEPALAPSLKAAGVMAARALFRAAPEPVRALVLSSGRTRRALGRAARGGGGAETEGPSGGVLAANGADGAELARRRADFAERQAVAEGARDPDFVGEEAEPIGAAPRVRAIAFYLPQYHAIPENDEWWGKGFTEWTNVAKAQPQFLGHHQPRLPGELGFYDLSQPDVLAQQAALARAYGIEGFCFYYYWFGGKRLLERPLDDLLARRDIDLPFCLCWANETWTRTWDGEGSRVLVEQKHDEADHARVFDDLARYLLDPRAMRVEGKPLLLVYRPDIIPDAKRLTDIWRERARSKGLGELHLVATNAFGFDEPERLGFDAIAQFPPHGVRQKRLDGDLAWINPRHAGTVFDYPTVVDGALEELERMPSRGPRIHPGVMPGWDNEARRPGRGVIYHGSSPAAFERWLAGAADHVERTMTGDARLLFVNAWNEWAEGAALEPDRRFGRAYLAACARALAKRD